MVLMVGAVDTGAKATGGGNVVFGVAAVAAAAVILRVCMLGNAVHIADGSVWRRPEMRLAA